MELIFKNQFGMNLKKFPMVKPAHTQILQKKLIIKKLFVPWVALMVRINFLLLYPATAL